MSETVSPEYRPGKSILVGVGLTILGVGGTVVGGVVAFILVFALGLELSNPLVGALVLSVIEVMYLLVGLAYVSQTHLSVEVGNVTRRNVTLAMGGYLAALAVAVASFAAIDALGLTLESAFGLGDTRVTPVQLVFTTVALVVVAVSEEYFFRGAIQQRLELGLDERDGLVVASLLFGAIHFFNYRGDVVAILLATLVLAGVGAIIGYVYQRSRALLVPIVVHFGYNLTLVGLTVAGFRLV